MAKRTRTRKPSPRLSVVAPTAADLLYAVRAKDEAEVDRHLITRAAFLQHVLVDERTQGLFERVIELAGIARLIDDAIATLDAAAREAGLPDRAGLTRAHLTPVRERLDAVWYQLSTALNDSQYAGLPFFETFVVVGLYGAREATEVPMRQWLAHDLRTYFEAGVIAEIDGKSHVELTPTRPRTLDAVSIGNRPLKREHLERNARWYYQTRVRAPRATITEIAEEYDATSPGARAPRDYSDPDRVDTKLVRVGIDEAERLLSLAVAPEQRRGLLQLFAHDVGGKAYS